jgi:hypothetical protein
MKTKMLMVEGMWTVSCIILKQANEKGRLITEVRKVQLQCIALRKKHKKNIVTT